jgi:PAS domain S-box-containing protein
MWEWNLRTGSVHFSPRWKSMLGYAEHELDDRLEEWHRRIHPEDRERVVTELYSHIEGKTSRFENEHRLRHRDGSYRWILARGAAVRNAAGKAYRVVGLHTDISARKQVQEALIEVADGLSTLSGEQCFRELTRRFAEVLGVREAFVCECSDYPTSRVRMLARWNHGQFANCVEFDLNGTSCEEVIREGRPLFVPGNIGARFPLEKTYGRESYLGLPCIDSQGRVIGHIACADGKEMRRELPHLAILKIFAIRAAVELERRMLERERSGLPGTSRPGDGIMVLH